MFDWSFINTDTIEKSGAIVVALVALFMMGYMFKKFSSLIGNHLSHQEKMQEREIKSRDEYTAKFSELITDMKNFFKK